VEDSVCTHKFWINYVIPPKTDDDFETYVAEEYWFKNGDTDIVLHKSGTVQRTYGLTITGDSEFNAYEKTFQGTTKKGATSRLQRNFGSSTVDPMTDSDGYIYAQFKTSNCTGGSGTGTGTGGGSPTGPVDPNGNLLALAVEKKQSSAKDNDYSKYNINYLVDGVKSKPQCYDQTNNWAASSNDPYEVSWTFVLPQAKKISSVNLYPVKGKNSLVEYYVTVGDNSNDALNAKCDGGTLKRVYENNEKETFNCGDLVGTRISVRGINKNKDWSFLCEIEAFGSDAPADYKPSYNQNILVNATQVLQSSAQDNDYVKYDKKYLTDGWKSSPLCDNSIGHFVSTNEGEK
jgi:hypothetical protein